MSERSGIRSLTVALYGDWQPKRLFALMAAVELKAFIDESGTHGGGLTVMAGWLGRAEQWSQFEPKWQSVLYRYGLPYLHAVDLKHGKKAFKNKVLWPIRRRMALAAELGKLAEDHALCSLTLLLNNSDYTNAYISGDKDLRKHRSVIDSKWGVCARVALSMLSQLAEQLGGSEAQVTVVFEAGAKNQGAAQAILADMYDVAPDRARFINPVIGYALKDQSPGAQAADLIAYGAYTQESAGIAEVSALGPDWVEQIETMPMMHLRAPITPNALRDIKDGQIAMGGLRRRLGRYWSELDGYPKGWMAQPLEIGGFVLTPPRSWRLPQQEAVSNPERPEPIGFVRLECE